MKKNSIKYNYNNVESKRLFEEFTLLLGKITENVEERENRLAYLEGELAKYSRLKYLLKMILIKILGYPSKLKNKIMMHKS